MDRIARQVRDLVTDPVTGRVYDADEVDPAVSQAVEDLTSLLSVCSTKDIPNLAGWAKYIGDPAFAREFIRDDTQVLMNPEDVEGETPLPVSVRPAFNSPLPNDLLSAVDTIADPAQRALVLAHVRKTTPWSRLLGEGIMRQQLGPAGLEKSPVDLIEAFFDVPLEQQELLFAPYILAITDHLDVMKTDLSVSFGFGYQPRVGGSSTPGQASRAPRFKASLPDLSQYSGEASSQVKVLHAMAAWVSTARDSASLAELSGSDAVQWAASKFTGKAKDWWLGYQHRSSLTSFDELLRTMASALVGPDAFDILVADLQRGSLRHHHTYDEYKAWLTRTVNAMRVFGGVRMWPERQLAGQVVQHLRGSLYREGVVEDPDTHDRPATYARAVDLMDARHRTLTNRMQAHGMLPLGAEPAVGGKRQRVTGSSGSGSGSGRGGGGHGGGGHGGGGHGGSGRSGSGRSGGGRGGGGRGGRDGSGGRNGGRGGANAGGARPSHTPEVRRMIANWAGKYGCSIADMARRFELNSPVGSHCVKCDRAGHDHRTCQNPPAGAESSRGG